jgi:hypothetical protein
MARVNVPKADEGVRSEALHQLALTRAFSAASPASGRGESKTNLAGREMST